MRSQTKKSQNNTHICSLHKNIRPVGLFRILKQPKKNRSSPLFVLCNPFHLFPTGSKKAPSKLQLHSWVWHDELCKTWKKHLQLSNYGYLFSGNLMIRFKFKGGNPLTGQRKKQSLQSTSLVSFRSFFFFGCKGKRMEPQWVFMVSNTVDGGATFFERAANKAGLES